jgi:glycosyltransferase involved in cell wall biosynthesis
VLAYYAVQGPALARIAQAVQEEMAPCADGAELVHNCRIGREGLSEASLRLARRRNIPFVLTPVHHPRWTGWIYRHYLRLYREADLVFALTGAERRALSRLGVDERRICVTGTGPVLADTHDGARFRHRHGLADHPVVLFLGQKYAYKGIDVLLQAAGHVWQRQPEARFVFAGPRTAYSRRLFARLAERRVIEPDTLTLQDKTDALAACDLFCLPSSQESFGAVFTEAWSLGKPVIGCDIPALREVVDSEVDGLLAPQDPAALAQRITYLLDRPAVRAEMGRQGRAKVAARFSWPRLAALTLEGYRSVL